MADACSKEFPIVSIERMKSSWVESETDTLGERTLSALEILGLIWQSILGQAQKPTAALLR